MRPRQAAHRSGSKHATSCTACESRGRFRPQRARAEKRGDCRIDASREADHGSGDAATATSSSRRNATSQWVGNGGIEGGGLSAATRGLKDRQRHIVVPAKEDRRRAADPGEPSPNLRAAVGSRERGLCRGNRGRRARSQACDVGRLHQNAPAGIDHARGSAALPLPPSNPVRPA